jgi:hypothetical protein
MSDAYSLLLTAASVIRELKINPWLVAVTLAIGAAWIEQKIARRNTPKFTVEHQGEAAHVRRHAPR